MRRHALDWRVDPATLARAAAALHLAALSVMVMTAWQVPQTGAVAALNGLASLHLAFLMATGAAAALFTLAAREARQTAPAPVNPGATDEGLRELMAQMSHDLRTPLNAVIGFSEVMLSELHGPLGNVRYQEYAHHISQSGGRLLKSSEDALAVTEAMSALMADRMQGRRERLVAGPLVREAWQAVQPANAGLRLTVTTCNACDIVGERRALLQALQHLLREAAAQAPAGSAIEVSGRRRGGERSLEIRVPAQATDPNCGPGSLRIILARLLLETQRASLTLTTTEDGTRRALIAFPARQ